MVRTEHSTKNPVLENENLVLSQTLKPNVVVIAIRLENFDRLLAGVIQNEIKFKRGKLYFKRMCL